MGSILKYRALEPIFKVRHNNGLTFGEGMTLSDSSWQIQKLLCYLPRLLFTILLVFTLNSVNGATYYSRVVTGNFATLSTWSTSPTGTPINTTALATTDVFIIQSGNTITVAANQTVAAITVNSGGQLTIGGITFTVNGTTNVSGTLLINSNTNAAKTFVDNVTINSGGTWTSTLATTVSRVVFRGGITNNSANNFSAGGATFNTNAQNLDGTGSFSFASVTVTGITLTNNRNLTVSAVLAGTGKLTNSSSGTLNLSGTGAGSCAITTLENDGIINRSAAGTTTTALANFTNTGTINITGSGTITGITNNANGIVNHSGSSTITSFNNATSTSTLNISTTPTVPTFTTLTVSAAGNTVNYNGAGDQTVKDIAYSNLSISGSGIKTWTLGAARTIGNNLTINSGTLTTAGNQTLGVTGLTSVSGTLNLGGTSAKTFTGAVTVNSGGVWNNTGNSSTSFAGGITNNGATFNNGTGAAAFSATQSLTGSGNMTFGGSVTPASGTTLTNSNSGIVTTGSVVLTGNFTQGSNNPTLALTSATPFSGAGSFDASTNTNTVNYSGAAQTGKVTNYSNLTISGTLAKTFATSPTVNGILSMEGTTASITVTTGVVSYGQDATLQYNKTTAFTATTEEWPATFSGTGGVKIVNTGVITFGGAKVITNNLSIGTGSSVNLGTFTTHTAGSLMLGGNAQSCGTWGYGPGTPPANKNQTFFANTSGYIMVGTIPAAPTSASPSSGIEICSGDGTYINAISAGNTINWYTTSTGGISIGSSASGEDFYVSPTVNTTYYAETQNAGGCVSATRTATATITVNTQITKNYLDIPYSLHSTVCAIADESNNLVITAPAGMFFVGVDFASYGTPNGSCGSYTIGSCNATTSISVCESYLLGNNSATIPATNAVFTDPCVGTYKRLYVQAVYNSTQYEICEGSSPGTITGSVPTGGNGTFTYLWESSTTNSSGGFVSAAGINNLKDYTPGALTQTTWFRRTVTSGGCSSTSVAVEITVNPAISITNPGAQIACDSYNLPSISGSNLSGNQKYYNNSQALGGTVITGPVPSTQTVWIYDTDGICSDEESFTVTIISRPIIDAIASIPALCSGGTLNPANPTVTANGSSVTSQGWQIETTAGGGIFGSLTLPYTVSYADNGKKIRYYATNSCGTAYSNEVNIPVTPLPTITSQPVSLTLCEGESGNLTVITSSPSPSYQWQYSNNPVGPWNITNGVAGVSGHLTNQLTITNAPIGYNNFYVSCIITSNSCSIQSDVVLITVNPIPATGDIIPD